MLKKLQAEVAEWSQRNFGNQPSHRPLLGVCEEVGELCHAHLKGEQGIRHTPAEIREMKIDAVADIVIYLADYCASESINLEWAVQTTWDKQVSKRNWKRGSSDAGGAER